MNFDQINRISEHLQMVACATRTVLMTDDFQPTTVNLPIPTLHAYMSIVVGLVDILPTLHQSKFHEKFAKIANEFLNWTPLVNDLVLLEDLTGMARYKSLRGRLLDLFDESFVAGPAHRSHNTSLSGSIQFQATNLPELANVIRRQKYDISTAVRIPLEKLFDKVAKTLQEDGQAKGYTISRAECATSYGLREPRIYWASKELARRIRKRSLGSSASQDSTETSQSPKRIRLADSQTSNDMF